MPSNPTDPIYVTWFITEKGRKKEVDIFEFIFRGIGVTAQKWNEVGLGSVFFRKGSLKIGEWELGHAPQTNLEANAFVLNLKSLQVGLDYQTYQNGLNAFYAVLNDKSKLIELEKKAYVKLVDLLRIYLTDPGNGQGSAFNMPSQYRSTPHSSVEKTASGRIRRVKQWSDSFRHDDRNYTEKWFHLLENIVLNKNPKVVGGAVLSFSLADLLGVQLSPTRSQLKSIFMMEEFGTGVFADPELRRPWRGDTTPFKVPQAIANKFDEPNAIYMWWPFRNFAVKAKLLYLNSLKKGSGAATNWIRQMRDTHSKKTSLKEYREEAYKRIKFYFTNKIQKQKGTNPLEWAYGRGPTGPGHPGREARHLFFNRNGLVERLKLIQRLAYIELLKLVDQEIAKTGIQGFPSIANVVFPG